MEIRRRSFATGGTFAQAMPNLGVIEIQEETYKNPMKRRIFRAIGYFEEIMHSDHMDLEPMRDIRRMEDISRELLLDLFKGKRDVATVKDLIVDHELICEQIYAKVRRLVEVLDQYTVQALNEESGTELHAKIGKRVLANRGTTTNQLYKKLALLEGKFGTWLVPRFAGFLALNDLVVKAPASTMIETSTIITDYEDRFNTIFETLMNQIAVNRDLYNRLNNDPCRDSLVDLFATLIDKLEIRTVLPGQQTEPLPLLDIPKDHTPQNVEQLSNIPEDGDIFSNRVRDLGDLFQPKNMIQDVYMLFRDYGCVIIRSKEGHDAYIPNPYVMGKKVRSHHYLQELFESLFATSMINQLIGRSIEKKQSNLLCPFCDARHDPRKETCDWDAYLGDTAKSWANAAQWEDYMGESAEILDEFIAVEVPGEDRLAAWRDYRRKTRMSVGESQTNF